MPRLVKIIAITLGASLALALGMAGIVAATFNPNDYKPLLIRLVQQKKQRTLTVPGAIKLTFFPKIGADLGQLSLSEHGSTAQFAAVDSARVSLQLLPLLRKQLVVDRVEISGIQANITRFKDGSFNFDDLLSKEEDSSQPIKLDVDSISVSNASVNFDDRQQERKIAITRLNLESGKIASGVPSQLALAADISGSNPVLDAKLSIKSGFTIDLEQKHYLLKGLDAAIKGRLAEFRELDIKAAGNADLKPAVMQFALDGITFSAGGKRAAQTIEARLNAPKLTISERSVSGDQLSGQARLTEGARAISADFSVPSFTGSPQAFRLPALALDVSIKDGRLDAKARVSGSVAGDLKQLLFSSPQLRLALQGKQGGSAINGTLNSPLSANLKTQRIELSHIAAAFTLPNPRGGTLKLAANGNAALDLGQQTVSSALKGTLDDSSFEAKLGLRTFAAPAYDFKLGIDRIDADRYQARPAAPPQQTGAATGAPIDLSGLKALNANGSLSVGALKVADLQMNNVRLALHAGRGQLDINPLSAKLYGGSLSGALSASASNAPRITVKQTLTGIRLGALLKDAIKKDPIDGTGNVQLDITTQGASIGQMKKALAGSARLDLRDGAVRGINLAQVIRDGKARIGILKGDAAPQSGTSSASEKTDFSELSGSFRIANGVAHNEDLSVKSPLFRLGGTGDINLGADRLDYLVKATIVSTLQGQGGPELQSLKGVTVPVKLSGPFSTIGWKIDFEHMVGDLAKQKIEQKKEEVKTRVEEKLKDALKGQLKGLFGN